MEDKIALAKNKLVDFYEKESGNVFVSFSGGKDSTVLLHLARSLFPNIKVVFSNTTNENLDVLNYVKTFEDITWVHPVLNFTQVVEKHGFPLVSKDNAQKISELKHSKSEKTRAIRTYGYQNHPLTMTEKKDKSGESIPKKGSGKLPIKWQFLAGETFDTTHKCCKILKKDPMEKWAKQNNDVKPIVGLMAGEGKLRQQLALYGSDDDKKSYPFLKTGWNEDDIWKYAKLHNIRFAECYYDKIVDGVSIKAETRTGCEFCGFGIHLEKENRLDRVKQRTPKRYEKMMNLKNNGVSFREALSLVVKKRI